MASVEQLEKQVTLLKSRVDLLEQLINGLLQQGKK